MIPIPFSSDQNDPFPGSFRWWDFSQICGKIPATLRALLISLPHSCGKNQNSPGLAPGARFQKLGVRCLWCNKRESALWISLVNKRWQASGRVPTFFKQSCMIKDLETFWVKGWDCSFKMRCPRHFQCQPHSPGAHLEHGLWLPGSGPINCELWVLAAMNPAHPLHEVGFLRLLAIKCHSFKCLHKHGSSVERTDSKTWRASRPFAVTLPLFLCSPVGCSCVKPHIHPRSGCTTSAEAASFWCSWVVTV